MKTFLSKSCFRMALGLVLTVGVLSSAGQSRAETTPSTILSTGTGWRLADVEPATPEINSVLWEVKRSAVETLPLSEFQKDIIRQSFAEIPMTSERGADDLLYFSYDVLQALENPSFPAGYEQFVEPDEKNTTSLSFCSWRTETRNRAYSYERSLLDFNVPFSAPFDGGISGSLPITGNVNLAVTYKIRKCLGVPVGFRFVNAVASGSASIAGNAELNATAQWEADWAKEWHLITIDLGEVSFMAGPIPIRLVFTLPIHYGVDFDVRLAGQVQASLDASATGTFNYTCTQSSCTGSSDFSDQFSFQEPTASVTLDMTAEAYVRALVRVALYDQSFLYVEGGAKAYAKASLWGYLGNACGDANGDGHNETVRALTADLLWGYKFAYGWGGVIDDELRYTGGGEYFIDWYDLLGPGGSTALQPMIVGPATVVQGQPATYTVQMRPCYKYTHNVTVAANPTTFTGAAPFAPSGGSTTITGSFANTGNQALTVTAVSDSFGRDLGIPYTRTINVTPTAPVSPNNLSATAAVGAVSLGWVDRSNNETSFEIQRRITGGTWAQLATTGANATGYLDSTVAAGTTYDYRVRARNSGGNSAWSNIASVTSQLGVPAAPSNLAVTYSAAQGKLTATWTDNANNETGFTLEFSYGGSAFSPVMGTLGANATSWVSGAGVPTGVYQFRVRANNANGSSAWSSVVSVNAF
ncbi:MAG: fibronectin type III domain-containing protein [Thermoanaerobaculia bacterium]|nr:fibronectin type III domain-containing protein [Thermoanaerobaculia bacterium]